jgi:hypothetical protein
MLTILYLYKLVYIFTQNKVAHTIFLLNNNDVDSTAEGCWVERVVGIPHGAKGRSHVLHPFRSPPLWPVFEQRDERGGCSLAVFFAGSCSSCEDGVGGLRHGRAGRLR